MAKNTLAKHMPRKVEDLLKQMGAQLRLARLRRKLTMDVVSKRSSCSPLTLAKAEKGDPTVSIGIYARILFALNLEKDIPLWAGEDPLGHIIQDSELMARKRAPKRKETI